MKSRAAPELLTYSQAADLLNVAPGTLYSWVSRGQVPHIRLSLRSVRFDREALLKWLDAGRMEAACKRRL